MQISHKRKLSSLSPINRLADQKRIAESKVLGEIYLQRLCSDRDGEKLLGLGSCLGRRQAQKETAPRH